jgi:hypothetical protein
MPETAGGQHALLIGMTLQEVALVVGLLLVVAFLLWRAYAKMKAGRRQTPQTRIRELLHPEADQDNLRDDMQRLLAELLEAAREMEAQLETRFRKLDVLIEQADERIAQLEHLLERLEQIRADDQPPPASKPPAKSTSRPRSGKRGRSGASKSPADAPKRPPQITGGRKVDHAEVRRLADQGLDAKQIALKLGMTVGEVELILALRNRE